MTSLDALEEYWTAELGQEVEIVARGWRHEPDDYALYVDGTFIISYKHLGEVESYLERLFMVGGSS